MDSANKNSAAIPEPVKKTDEAGGGFFKNNGGLLIGGAVALFAIFGMEGGFLSALVSIGALIMGVLADDKKGIFGGLFSNSGSSTSIAPYISPGRNIMPYQSIETQATAKQNEVSQPQKDEFYRNVELGNYGTTTTFYMNKKGDRVPDGKSEPHLMKINVNSDGKAIGVAVANEKGVFDRDNKNEVIMSKVPDNISFKIGSNTTMDISHIVLQSDHTKQLDELRKIGSDALLERKLRIKSFESFNVTSADSISPSSTPTTNGVNSGKTLVV